MKRAFTLIELLVVIAIIAILAAILFPVFGQAKLAAKKTKALAQMKQLGISVMMYAEDYDDYFVPASMRTTNTSVDPEIWPAKVEPYVKNKDIFLAPIAPDSTFADTWANRRNQSIGYSDATGIDPNPATQGVPGAALPGTEGFAAAASFSQAEFVAQTGLFATTPNGPNVSTSKERGYVFNPYNGPNSPDGDYSKGLPLIGDVNLCRTAYKGVDYSTRSAGNLKPIYAAYGGNGSGDGSTPVIFADGHARNYSANKLNAFGTVIWRFR